MSDLEFVFEIRPDGQGWSLIREHEGYTAHFATFEAAERRARFLAIRQNVRGVASVVHILDAAGDRVGAWRGERYSRPRDPYAFLQAA